MKKWTDYLISEVSYDSEHLISIATRHQDTDNGITKGKPIDRLTIASDIKNGLHTLQFTVGKILGNLVTNLIFFQLKAVLILD